MIIDYSDKLWVATNQRLISYCLKDLKFTKCHFIKKEFSYSQISEPSKLSSTLLSSFDKKSLIWFQSNYSLAILDVKTQEIVNILKDIVKLGKNCYNFFS